MLLADVAQNTFFLNNFEYKNMIAN